jgi:hypothetical protein
MIVWIKRIKWFKRAYDLAEFAWDAILEVLS